MDGHIAPMAAICDLADKYGALVMIDEAHATGVYSCWNSCRCPSHHATECTKPDHPRGGDDEAPEDDGEGPPEGRPEGPPSGTPGPPDGTPGGPPEGTPGAADTP